MTTPAGRQLWVWYTPCALGGVENYLLRMMPALRARGFDPAIAATSSLAGPLSGTYPPEVPILDWTGFLEAFMGRAPQPPVRQCLAADLARWQPSLIVLNDCLGFTLGAAPLLKAIRPWCTLIDVLHIDPPESSYFSRRVPLSGLFDGVVGTSERALDRLRALGATYPMRYVRNAASVPRRARRPREERLRLLYVGRLEQSQKRVLQLPEVVAQVVARGRSCALTVLGDGPDRGALEAAIASRGLTSYVEIRGARPPAEALQAYFDHDVLLSLSLYEGFSLTLLEALAAGCVPVCTDLPALDRAVFENGVTCLLFPPGRPEAAANILASLNGTDLDRLSAAAQARAAPLTPEATCDATLEFVVELRARRPPLIWPSDIERRLAIEWDLTEGNPWLPRTNPLRRFARMILGSSS